MIRQYLSCYVLLVLVWNQLSGRLTSMHTDAMSEATGDLVAACCSFWNDMKQNHRNLRSVEFCWHCWPPSWLRMAQRYFRRRGLKLRYLQMLNCWQMLLWYVQISSWWYCLILLVKGGACCQQHDGPKSPPSTSALVKERQGHMTEMWMIIIGTWTCAKIAEQSVHKVFLCKILQDMLDLHPWAILSISSGGMAVKCNTFQHQLAGRLHRFHHSLSAMISVPSGFRSYLVRHAPFGAMRPLVRPEIRGVSIISCCSSWTSLDCDSTWPWSPSGYWLVWATW